ncbi:MAG: histidine kinase, partial [Desulfobulbus sp.]
APEPDGIIITISDNGPGISQKVQKSIFEPFFTTKPAGEGTGLGLSVSYFIITAHHSGRIEVDSTPGQGTTFTIRLPINKVRKSN